MEVEGEVGVEVAVEVGVELEQGRTVEAQHGTATCDRPLLHPPVKYVCENLRGLGLPGDVLLHLYCMVLCCAVRCCAWRARAGGDGVARSTSKRPQLPL